MKSTTVYLHRYPGVGAGVGEGKGVGVERGTPGVNQGEKSLQSCPQLLLVCGALPWRWEGDEEGATLS